MAKKQDPDTKEFIATMNAVTKAVANSSLMRHQFLNKLMDPRRDLDKECGYPTELTNEHYVTQFDRNELAERIVRLYPEESWAKTPEVYEDEDPEVETEFEKAWNDLVKTRDLWTVLKNADILAGVGRYGVILLGIDDGKEFHEPADGFDKHGEPVQTTKPRKLLYTRTLPEHLAPIASFESDRTSARYGKPLFYNLNLVDPNSLAVSVLPSGTAQGSTQSGESLTVHWTRVVHVPPEVCLISDIFGRPRLQVVFNRLCDLAKLLGGSAEMFWRGAFPGYSFEVNPDIADEVELDPVAVRKEMENFSNKLQRYIALQGVSAKSLAPQVADPASHVEVQLMMIALSLGCPLRVLKGTEHGKEAGDQDNSAWNDRVEQRCETYNTPKLVRATVRQLVGLGVLPYVETNEIHVDWPDLNAPSDKQKADVAQVLTTCLASYISGGVNQVMPPLEYLTLVMKFTTEEALQVIEAAVQQQVEMEDEFAEQQEELDLGPAMESEEVDPEAVPANTPPQPPANQPPAPIMPKAAAKSAKGKKPPKE